MRISDCSSDVCASDLDDPQAVRAELPYGLRRGLLDRVRDADQAGDLAIHRDEHHGLAIATQILCLAGEVTSVHAKVIYQARVAERDPPAFNRADDRSEEHTSELQSLMRISYAVFC